MRRAPKKAEENFSMVWNKIWFIIIVYDPLKVPIHASLTLAVFSEGRSLVDCRCGNPCSKAAAMPTV